MAFFFSLFNQKSARKDFSSSCFYERKQQFAIEFLAQHKKK